MEAYDTMSEAVNALVKQGYSYNFNVKFDYLLSSDQKFQLKPGDFIIEKVFRFEGITDPADSCVVYAINSPKYGIKGTLVNGYGIYSDTMSDDLVEQLEIRRTTPS
jgi:hypothetical protein